MSSRAHRYSDNEEEEEKVDPKLMKKFEKLKRKAEAKRQLKLQQKEQDDQHASQVALLWNDLPESKDKSWENLLALLGERRAPYLELIRQEYLAQNNKNLLYLTPTQDENGLGGFVLSLDCHAPVSPRLHVNQVAPFACFALYTLRLRENMEIDSVRKSIRDHLREALIPILNALPPRLEEFPGVRPDDPKTIADDKEEWKPYIPSNEGFVGAYVHGEQLYLAINTNMGDNVGNELSEYLRLHTLTAEEFSKLPQVQWLQQMTVRNVKRIIAVIVAELVEAGLILDDESYLVDTRAFTESKEEEKPRLINPTFSLLYNDLYYDSLNHRVNFYHKVSMGHSVAKHILQANDVVIFGDHYDGLYRLPNGGDYLRDHALKHRHPLIYPINTGRGASQTKKKNPKIIMSLAYGENDQFYKTFSPHIFAALAPEFDSKKFDHLRPLFVFVP